MLLCSGRLSSFILLKMTTDFIQFVIKFYLQIIPPPEFHPHSKRIAGNKLLKPIIQQYKSPIPRTKSFVLCHNGEHKMTYASFVKKARDREALFGALTMKEAENKFWSNQHDAYYGIDLSISLFGDECQWWNLSKFTQAESLLHHVNRL